MWRRIADGAPWAAVLLAAAWSAAPSPWWLPAIGALVVVGGLTDRRALPARMALVALLVVVPAGLLTQHRLDRLASDWSGYWSAREAEVFSDLTRALDDLVTRGDRAADELAEAGSFGLPGPERLREIRIRHGMDLAAVYDAGAEPAVWVGTHRGKVPEEVQRGEAPYLFEQLPLFSYLYFTRPAPALGGTLVVGRLLSSELPADLRARPGDFLSAIEDATGEEIRVSRAGRRPAEGGFPFVWESGEGPDTLFSLAVVRPVEAERRSEILDGRRRLVTGLLLVAWLLLVVASRRDPAGRWWAVGTLSGIALLLPLEVLVGGTDWLAPGYFQLPVGPVDLSLGRLLLLLLAAAVAVASPGGERRGGVPTPLVGVVGGLAFLAVVAAVSGAASTGFLAGPDDGWVVLQLALSLALALVTVVLVSAAGRGAAPTGRPLRLVAALLVAAGLTSACVSVASRTAALPLWPLALWGVPLALVTEYLRALRGWRRSLLAWSVAVVLGTLAALPYTWQARIEARMAVAESQMERLGADVDPFLSFLLSRMALAVESLHEGGADPVEVLYRGWLESGLAREGYPIWLTLWGPGGLPQEELPIRVRRSRPEPVERFAYLAVEDASPTVRRFQRVDLHYLLTVPLTDGSVVTGAVPPIRELGLGSPLGPLVGALGGEVTDPLTLVPLLPGDRARHGPRLEWVRTAEGWQGEMLLTYPGAVTSDGSEGTPQRFHAHYLVDLPGPAVLVARATLLLVLNLGLVLLLWLLVRVGLLGRRPSGVDLRPLVTSFRARLTAALFGFFLLSNAIFGTLAYRTIAGAAERAARVLAERVVRDGAAIYNEVGGRMELLGRQVGADLLEYRAGELREGSTEELVELGLFEGWLPYEVDRRLSDREDLVAVRDERLGRWEYVTAFRRLPDGDILAAPVPLQAGATAVRRGEVAHLLGFAIVAGGLLSFVLALLVGRALARPIGTLQVASERVGRGNLGVRLPTDRGDEFGSVFRAFNRMVRRLRRARRDLVRTTRRTQAIVEDAATGVIALDSAGRVTLANRRASELLGHEIGVGERLKGAGGPAHEILDWVRLYFRDDLREAGTEFQLGERRLRVRARRISREGAPGGAVLSVEDVTDELRSERILAWGEMARQVAHEVKNPLTPIKLAIQHIRRAWEDRSPDFGEIMDRNVEAALLEIDRLASIASSFSRFGAPEVAGAHPLEPVDLGALVDQVLTLYRSGEGRVRFEAAAGGVSTVRARPTEMKEVLLNLLENARAAIESEGMVRIVAREEGDAVLLEVHDDGVGIAPGLVPRVFEPHFSTRSAGTGLGLAIVKRLVESWGASVSLESEEGEGTVVRMRLRPWEDDGEAPGGPDGDTGAASPGGGAGPGTGGRGTPKPHDRGDA